MTFTIHSPWTTWLALFSLDSCSLEVCGNRLSEENIISCE